MRSKRFIAFLAVISLLLGMTACGYEQNEQSISNGTQDEIADGTPTDTVLPPDIRDSDYADTAPTSAERQTIYLWREDNMPTVTVNTDGGNDPADFRPSVTSVPVKEGVGIKGAVLVCAGGAFMFRSDENEGYPVAERLAELGYQAFVVDYRIRPYTMEEGSLDLARAVRYVRYHANEYGINEKDIAVMGFSAGGILCGDLLLNFDGLINGTTLDPDYIPDGLDKVSADTCAVGMIYSFYGRLSVASTDVEKFKSADLPPTYFLYGTEDPFYRQFGLCAEATREAGIETVEIVLQDTPHGFGYRGNWIPEYAQWLDNIMRNN